MEEVAVLMDDSIKLTLKIEKSFNLVDKQCLLREFKAVLGNEEWKNDITAIRERVEEFALKFPMPGFPAL